MAGIWGILGYFKVGIEYGMGAGLKVFVRLPELRLLGLWSLPALFENIYYWL